MGSWGKLLAIAAIAVGLPAVHAQELSFRIPVAVAPAAIEWEVAYTGGWEVTVEYDAADCAIYCTYRRIHGGLLLPPVTTLHVYSGGPSAPATVAVDPAGVGSPGLSDTAAAIEDAACLAPRGWLAPVRFAAARLVETRRTMAAAPAAVSLIFGEGCLPLRI